MSMQHGSISLHKKQSLDSRHSIDDILIKDLGLPYISIGSWRVDIDMCYMTRDAELRKASLIILVTFDIIDALQEYKH